MLVSLVLEVTPVRRSLLPPTVGNFVHALLLDQVKQVSPELSEALHGDSDSKPFTVSPLMGRTVREGEMRVLEPGTTYTLRFTSLANPLSGMLLEWAARESWPVLRILGAELQVTQATVDPAKHAWAGSVSYDAFWEAHFATAEAPAPAIQLEFESPTSFRSQGLNVPLPLPRLVFHGLREKWESHSPVHLGDDLLEKIEAHIGVAAHEVRSMMASYGRAKSVGFVGWARYRGFKETPEPLLRAVHLLGDFAFYAGTGLRTTMGMGMTRVMTRAK